MKNIHKLAGLLAASAGLVWAVGGDFTGHTWFTTRKIFEKGDPVYESLFRNDRMELAEDGRGNAIEVALFGSKSTHPAGLARYFMPFGKTTLNVVEFKTEALTPDGAFNRDVEARNFNIQTINSLLDDGLDNAFRSQISFCPHQTVGGVGFVWKKALSRCEDGTPRWWFEVNIPVVHIRNDMRLTESVIQNGGGAAPIIGLDNAPRVGNMVQAFKQTAMRYSKINGCSMTRHGVADVEFMLGWNNVNHGVCHFYSYAGIIAPTGNRPNGEYLFQPIVGNNHHIGIMWGSNIGFDLWSCGEHNVRMELDWVSRYLFRNRQMRTFDLYRSEWSRFLEVYATEADAQAAFLTANPDSGSFGVNELTRCVLVSPRFNFMHNAAFIYERRNFSLEGGWNFYARQSEKVQLEDFPTGVQVKDISGAGATNLARTITNNFPGSVIPFSTATYTPLRLSDVNIESAAHPAVLSYTIYATAGYTWRDLAYPTFVGLGGSYEFASVNTTMDRWIGWGKFGISF